MVMDLIDIGFFLQIEDILRSLPSSKIQLSPLERLRDDLFDIL